MCSEDFFGIYDCIPCTFCSCTYIKSKIYIRSLSGCLYLLGIVQTPNILHFCLLDFAVDLESATCLYDSLVRVGQIMWTNGLLR